MPVRRAVPRAPITSHLYRRLARVPAGGATSLACAAAGLACAIGLAVVRPQVDLPGLFDRGDDRSPAAVQAPVAPAIHEGPVSVPSERAPSRVRLSRSGSVSGGAAIPTRVQPAPTDSKTGRGIRRPARQRRRHRLHHRPRSQPWWSRVMARRTRIATTTKSGGIETRWSITTSRETRTSIATTITRPRDGRTMAVGKRSGTSRPTGGDRASRHSGVSSRDAARRHLLRLRTPPVIVGARRESHHQVGPSIRTARDRISRYASAGVVTLAKRPRPVCERRRCSWTTGRDRCEW